jgi:hypothetical protein
MPEHAYGLLAEFDSPETLTAAAKKARAAGYRRLDAFTPFPVDGLARILGHPPSNIPLIGLIGGIAGGGLALLMQCYVNYDFPINVGGRPLYAISAFAIVMFELTILFSALSMIVAMLWQNGLPRLSHPLFGATRFHLASRNRFFLCISAEDGEFNEERTSSLLRRLGASSVELVKQ